MEDVTGAASDQSYALAEETELRMECSHSSVVMVQLESGSAEVFGAEMHIGVPVNVTGQKLAVFTWSGATVRVEGKPLWIKQASETPMRSYHELHIMLAARREEALRRSSQASTTGAAASEVHHGPRVIVLGPTDSGKSTLCKMLANWAVRAGFQPTVVDLDVGQGSITVPGCIAATPIEAPISIEEGFSLDAPLVYFYGHASPSENDALYTHLVGHMGNILEQRAASSTQVAASGLIINTLGWVDNLGYDLNITAVESLNADVVVVMEMDRLYSQVSRHFQGKPHVTVMKLSKSGGVVTRDRDERRTARDRRVREYFTGPRDNLVPVTAVIKSNQLTVYRVGGAMRPVNPLPFRYTPNRDPLQISNLPAGTDLAQSLMAVSHASSPEQILSTNVAGFVLVTGVDTARGTITYLSPCPGPLPGRFLVAGSLRSVIS